MERDPHISRLIRESGIVKAPKNLTENVMNQIAPAPAKKSYKPLIGRGGRALVVLFIIGIALVSWIYTEPGGKLMGITEKFSGLEWQLPRMNLNLEFLLQINPSTGLISALVAIFILVLFDAGLSRRRIF